MRIQTLFGTRYYVRFSFPQISNLKELIMSLHRYSVWLFTDRDWMICFNNVFLRLDNRCTPTILLFMFLSCTFFSLLLQIYYLFSFGSMREYTSVTSATETGNNKVHNRGAEELITDAIQQGHLANHGGKKSTRIKITNSRLKDFDCSKV